jgi:predicted membrane protein
MLTSGVFWGCLLILWGASVIIETVFQIHIPLFRIVFAFVLIYIGVRIMTGRAWWPGSASIATEHESVFGNAQFGGKDLKDEYSSVFGNGDVDLTQAEVGKDGGKIAVHTVFGHSIIRVNPKTPIRVRGTAAFGEMVTPDGKQAAFGETTWESPAVKPGVKPLEIRAEAVFAKVEIVTK